MGENTALELYKAPCHANYGSGCCGIFIEVVGGDLICNECGMGIIELLNSQKPPALGKAHEAFEFQEASKPLTEWIKSQNDQTHLTVVADINGAEAFIGVRSCKTPAFKKQRDK